MALILCSCEPSKEKVDLISVNANVYTLDGKFSKAQSFPVKDGKFLAIGTDEEITTLYIATQFINANGKTIVPDLIDAHCHFFGLGMDQ